MSTQVNTRTPIYPRDLPIPTQPEEDAMSTATETITRVYRTDVYYGYRYPLPSRYRRNIMASEDERWAVLATIGIERREDRSPLEAWRDAVADASGIDRARLDPSQGGALDLCFSESPVREFVFYLA